MTAYGHRNLCSCRCRSEKKDGRCRRDSHAASCGLGLDAFHYGEFVAFGIRCLRPPADARDFRLRRDDSATQLLDLLGVLVDGFHQDVVGGLVLLILLLHQTAIDIHPYLYAHSFFCTQAEKELRRGISTGWVSFPGSHVLP
jgi:hypothetical protein